MLKYFITRIFVRVRFLRSNSVAKKQAQLAVKQYRRGLLTRAELDFYLEDLRSVQ